MGTFTMSRGVMNTNHLSVDEIVQYISSGVITEVGGEDFLRVVEEYEERVKDSFDDGMKVGYDKAEAYYYD